VSSPKNFLIAFFALTTVAAGGLAWRQHLRLQIPAAAAPDSARDELLRKLSAAERRAADLESRLAAFASSAAPAPTGDETAAAPETPAEVTPPRDRAGGSRRAEFAALMNDPAVVRLMNEQQKAGLDGRYAALFKQLNLTPEELERFKNLLVEKRTALRDVLVAAREQGLAPGQNRGELRTLVEQSNAEIDSSIRELLGPEKYNTYQTYETTGAQRSLVEQIDRSLSYTSAPLTAAQNQALVKIFAQSATAVSSAPRPGLLFAGPDGVGAGRVTITDTMVNQAAAILSPTQLAAVKTQQASQQAERQLRELMRRPTQAGQPRP
jgi:hypothetical protein